MTKRLVLAAIAASLLIAPLARAADLPVKAPVSPLSYQYPTKKCGLYYGVNTSGNTAAVSNAVAGTQIVQGAIGFTVGYTCPAGAGFWFVDGDLDIANLNGGKQSGFDFNGGAQFTERFGFGAPVDMLISLIPGLQSLQNAVPSVIPLPAGVSVTTTSPYIFGAFHQDDVGQQNGLQNFKQYMLSGGIGLGSKIRLTNGIVFDPSAEYVFPGSRVCVGPAGLGCINEGQGFRVVGRLEF